MLFGKLLYYCRSDAVKAKNEITQIEGKKIAIDFADPKRKKKRIREKKKQAEPPPKETPKESKKKVSFDSDSENETEEVEQPVKVQEETSPKKDKEEGKYCQIAAHSLL